MDLAGNVYNMKVHSLISLLPPDKLSWKTNFFLPTMQLIRFHNTPSYPTLRCHLAETTLLKQWGGWAVGPAQAVIGEYP